jgi:hypothetical protein
MYFVAMEVSCGRERSGGMRGGWAERQLPVASVVLQAKGT